jgi:transposase
METISTIGLDIAKRVFQVHGVDAKGRVVMQKQLRREDVLDWFGKLEPCLVGMESCATSTWWAREIGKLGHDVRLIPPAYVKPYVRRQKNDRADAAAICEAVSRPSMRFVGIKTVEQQAIQVLHRSRELLMVQRTQTINALRAHLAEFGVIFPLGNAGVAQAIVYVREVKMTDVPAVALQVLASLVEQTEHLAQEIAKLDKQMLAWHRANEGSKRLAAIPGIGVVTATAIVAAAGDGKQFATGREFSAWLGLVPNQNSSGGKERLGRISKKGNPYVRKLLVVGATSLLRGKSRDKAVGGVWFAEVLKRKQARVATVALANKMARVAWAVLTKNEAYRVSPAVANDTKISAFSAPAGVAA